MSSAYYDLYIKGVYDLASTMVIKSEDTATAINKRLKDILYAVDDYEPTTWRYYMNLAGRYHESDVPMTVKSLDTEEVIPFTLEALKEHTTTRREYTYSSQYYQELSARYPTQTRLILGILNPINIDAAIAADDHTILWVDPLLVEGWEINFKERLQRWVTAVLTRWDVVDYRQTNDTLYVASRLAVMFAFLPIAIHLVRLQNCKTDFAHTFHIKQYLASNGKLTAQFDYLTRKQQLFLYRNIRWINRNNGKVETFDLLTQKMLTDRNFPLAEYIIRHNTEQQPDNIYPSIEMNRQTLNGLHAALGQDIKSVKEVLEMENDLARENSIVLSDANEAIPLVMRNSLDSALNTKVLESNVLDKTDAEPFTLTEVVLNHWIYLSNIGLYNTVLSVNNPGTGEMMRIGAKDAFTLYLYTYNKAMGYTFEHIPRLEALRVRRVKQPMPAELKGLVERKYVPHELIDYAFENQPAIGNYISVDSFRNAAIDIHQAMLRHRDLAVYQPHYKTRGQLKQATDRFYMDYPIDPENGQSYSSWFKERSLDVEQLSDLELELLSNDLFTLATGQDAATTKSLKQIHAAMLSVMGQLSSYSVQYIQTINSGTLKIVDWPYLRPGDTSYKAFNFIKARNNGVNAHWLTGYHHRMLFNRLSGISNSVFSFKSKTEVYYELDLDYKLVASSATAYHGCRLGVDSMYVPPDVLELEEAVGEGVADAYEDLTVYSLASVFESLTSPAYVPLTAAQKTTLLTTMA